MPKAPRPPLRKRPTRSAERRRAHPLYTVLLWGTVTVAALAAATATFLFIATPTDLLRDRVVEEVRKQTGRDLSVAGGVSLSLFPSIGVSLRDVALSAPPGMPGVPMARVAEMTIETPLRQLLVGDLTIEQLVLHRPELDLRIDADGRRNWVFDRPDRQAAGSSRSAGGTPSGRSLSGLQAFPIANVRIEDGTLRYVDEKRKVRETITSLDLEVSVTSLTSPLETRGDFMLRDQEVRFRGSLDSLSTLLAGLPSQVAVRLTGEPIDATYEGTISTAPVTRLAGALDVKAGSLHGLTAWFGTSLPEDEPDGPVLLGGKLETTATSIALTETNAEVAGRAINGFAVLETRTEPRPRLSADLRISALDLDHLLRPDGERARGRSDGRNQDGEGDSGEAQRPQTIDDLLRGTQSGEPRVRGFIARHGWSDVPFDLDALGDLDGEVKLRIDRLTYRDLQARDARITATLMDRVLDASIDRMQLYEGTGSGTIQLDAAGSVPELQANLQLVEVSALDLLKDAAEFDWVDGKSRISFAIRGEGRTEREMVETLDGDAQLAFSDGALVGFDIPGMITGLQQGRIPRLQRNEADRTRFNELAASFTIKDGVAENRDLSLASPLVRVTGSGSANLARRTLDYTVRPALVTASARQGSGEPAGLELPIRITGSWDRPTYTADMDAVVKNSDDVVEAVKEIGRQLKGKDLKGALQDLLGDDENGNPSSEKPKAKDLLRQLLRP